MKKVRVIDAFTFYNEFEVLELRLRELDDIVDFFVLVEATSTFAGDRKPLLYEQESSRFSQWSDKIVHFAVDNLPSGNNRWLAEIAQRDAIRDAIRALPEPLEQQDLVLISDVDEIPRRSAIAQLRDAPPTDGIIALEMASFVYQLNLRARGNMYAARAVRGSVFELLTPNEIRRCPWTARVSDAGWHFTYLSSRNETVERIQAKVSSFAHDELDSADVLDRRRLDRLIKARLFFVPGEPVPLEAIPVDDSFPQAVRDDPERWKPFVVALNRWPTLDHLWYRATRLLFVGIKLGQRARRRVSR